MTFRPAPGQVFALRPHEETSALEVTLWHDVLCGWCYVADARLDYLRDEYGGLVRFSLRPYPLRPDNQPPDKKERLALARGFRKVAREPEGKGIKADLWTGTDVPHSSMPPLMALEAALLQGPEVQRELLLAMRKAAFHDGINIARRDVQLELAARVGLDVSEFLHALDNPRLEQQIHDSVAEAEAIGIKGVPALVIGGEWLMQGCRDLSEYRQVIDKYLRERVTPAQVRMMH